MRIALIIERFQPEGGVESAAWATAHALAQAGCDVNVFAREARDAEGIAVHRLDVGRGWQPRRVLAFSRAAAAAAPRGRFDAVHSFSRTRHQDLFRAGGGCHAAYMERAYPPTGARLRRLSPRHAVLLRIEAQVFGDESQWIHCNSEMVRDEIRARYDVAPSRFAVIPNGVDLDRFRPRPADPDARALRQSLGAEGRPVWLLVGHGYHRKGMDTAIRALARSGSRESVLWLAGREGGDAAAALTAELGVGTRVRWLGTEHDPAALYAAADGLLLPTRYDAFANVCLEAAASGLAIITSGANGAAGWLGDAGLCVDDPEDVGGFAAALDEIWDDARRRELAAAARERAERRSWSATARELRALYERILR